MGAGVATLVRRGEVNLGKSEEEEGRVEWKGRQATP